MHWNGPQAEWIRMSILHSPWTAKSESTPWSTGICTHQRVKASIIAGSSNKRSKGLTSEIRQSTEQYRTILEHTDALCLTLMNNRQ